MVFRALLARLFAGAGRGRYAWRPVATRAGGSKLVAAARPPRRIGRRGWGLSFAGERQRWVANGEKKMTFGCGPDSDRLNP